MYHLQQTMAPEFSSALSTYGIKNETLFILCANSNKCHRKYIRMLNKRHTDSFFLRYQRHVIK